MIIRCPHCYTIMTASDHPDPLNPKLPVLTHAVTCPKCDREYSVTLTLTKDGRG